MMTRSQGKLRAREPTANPRRRQILARSLSDSCSSSAGSGEARKKRKGPTSASMWKKGKQEKDKHPTSASMWKKGKQEKDKRTHSWTAAEELFLLTPFSIDPAAEKKKLMAGKSKYHTIAAGKLNEAFGDNSHGWVPFSADKIKSKLKIFADRYTYYQANGHPYVNKVPIEPYKQVEYYIALYGWIFLEPSPSRSGSGSRSRSHSPSASSRVVSKQRKTSHIPVDSDDENIKAAAKYMLEHAGAENFYWYLKLLHETVVRTGFWLLDDFEKRKKYLDDLLPMVKMQNNGMFQNNEADDSSAHAVIP